MSLLQHIQEVPQRVGGYGLIAARSKLSEPAIETDLEHAQESQRGVKWVLPAVEEPRAPLCPGSLTPPGPYCRSPKLQPHLVRDPTQL